MRPAAMEAPILVIVWRSGWASHGVVAGKAEGDAFMSRVGFELEAVVGRAFCR